MEPIKIRKGKGNYDYAPSKGGKLLNAKDMAKYAGISEVAFSNGWIAKGCPFIPDPMKPKNKLYPSASVMKWRFEKDLTAHDLKIIGEIEETQDRMTAHEADLRKKSAEALIMELKLAKELEKVANIEDLMNNFGNAVGHVTATLLGWKANLTGLLAMQDEKVVDDILDSEVTRILEALKDYKHNFEGVDEEQS